MKKLVFLFAMVFAVSMAMGQNTESTTQLGDYNNASVSQTGADNKADVFQNSYATSLAEKNLVSVSQSSDENKAYVEQGSTLPDDVRKLKNAKATIEQKTGDVNVAKIYQNNDNYVADFHDVQAKIEQDGGMNNAEIIQNKWTYWAPVDNKVTVSQIGESQYAKFETTSNGFGVANAGGSVSQEGFFNRATVLQDVERDAQAYITQKNYTNDVASRNYADVFQESGGTGGRVVINQDGDANFSYAFQNAGSADINQVGDGNRTDLWQNKKNEYADIDQLTDDNTAYLIQNDNDNRAIILQHGGDSNSAKLSQSGGAYANIEQNGEGNILRGVSSGIATSLNGSTLMLTQTGNGNLLKLDQTNGASANVMQDGMTNTSLVIQN